MKQIIITDLTRFSRDNIVCTAGTDTKSGACIRPMPYFARAMCEKLGILPGAILRGDFSPKKGLSGPHQEDAAYTPEKLFFVGPSSSGEFKAALESGLCGSVETGFEIDLGDGQKHIPVGHPIKRSIITLAADPESIEIAEDNYGKTRIHFTDMSGKEFSYFPITDLGFHRYADSHRAAKKLKRVNSFVRAQPEVYLRLGLSRAWVNPQGINGYWMQVNGVYTFPKFFEEIRSYR